MRASRSSAHGLLSQGVLETVVLGRDVAPGFNFADWELPPRATLRARYPEHAQLMQQLSHPG